MYPKQFFEQETRRGFTISEVMKRSWAADMDMIISLSQICEQHSLRFFACYGTLLGAVREHGYIPWDDDIDIGLLRDDYIRLLDILESGYSDYFNVLNPYTRSWYHMNFSHITNSRTTSFERKHLEDWHGCPFMTGPDVYPYYYIPRDVEKEKVILGLLERIDRVIAMNGESQDRLSASGKFDDKDRLNEIIAAELIGLQKDTGYIFSTDRPLENQLEILYDQVCRVTQKEEADYVCRYDEYYKDRTKKFPKDYFEHTIELPFERITMPVPIGYDAILKARFGNDYIVPRQENAAHDYPYYQKQLNEKEYYEKQSVFIQMGKSFLPTFDSKALKNTQKKKILFHTSAREMLIHCNYSIDSIKSVLDNKDENEVIIWMPDQLINTDDNRLELVAPTLFREFDELLKKYRKSFDIYRVPLQDELNIIVNFFDEYRGDDGEIAKCFRQVGKKVEITDYCKCLVNYSDKDTIDYKYKSDKKKTVLYITSVSVLYQNQGSIIEKIQRSLSVLSKNKDYISVVWKAPNVVRDYPNIFDNDFAERYQKVIDEYKNDNLGIVLDSDEFEIDFADVDAVFGDPDEYMMKAIELGKPVMIQNINV